MSHTRFDWRWVALIALVVLLANSSFIPWPLIVLALAGGGGYLLYMGWNVWSGGTTSAKRVTYWRGQRIETPAKSGTGLPPWRAIVPALLYLLIGAAFLLSAVAILLKQL